MAKIILGIVIVFALIAGVQWLNNKGSDSKPMTSTETGKMAVEDEDTRPVEVRPIAHATMVLRWGETVIYTDPVGGAAVFVGQPTPDVVLVTDIHGDHLNAETLGAVLGDATLIVPQAVKDLLPADLAARARVMENGVTLIDHGLQIEALPMYNLPEAADSRHAKGRGNGYVIEKESYRVYIAGDTAGIPEMRALEAIDIAFVPMNLPFTMDVDEAANAVIAFAPKHVYPYHYRGQNGLSDVGRFKALVTAGNPDIDVVLADWYPAQ
jgi:L-ascorbate metabolism protein UlaG (beta-lactamase superfamily)